MIRISDIKFKLISRFCVTCFFNKEFKNEQLKEDLNNQIKESGFSITDLTLHNLGKFKYEEYSYLGVIQIDLSKLNILAPEPPELFKTSTVIEKICEEYNRNKNREIQLDTINPPYAINIATKVSGMPEGENFEAFWKKDIINKYKKELGKWIEFYSGQWPDYSDQLYHSRIQNNLSNRLSEVHFIRPNSSFVFLPESGYDANIPYMNEYFFKQILKVRALLFCYYILNDEIDQTNELIPVLRKQPLKDIEKEIERVEDLNRLIQDLASEVFSERIINRRAHSRKVLNTCYQLFQIDLTSTTIEEKIESLRKELSSEREKNQQNLATQQKRWLLILNVFLGSQFIFTMKENIVDYLDLKTQNSALVNLLDTVLIISVGIIVIVAIVGLLYTWVRKNLSFGKLIQKKVE